MLRTNCCLTATWLVICGHLANAAPVPIDLSTWNVVQYAFPTQDDANWVLSNGNTVATQIINADASIFLSDFNIASKSIEGSWRVDTAGDDDFMGFVFGYQGRDQYYLFDWKQTNQNHVGFAERGMSLKVVNVPGNADPTASDLWPTAGSANVTVLRHNTVPWANFTDYNFQLDFFPGQFTIEVRQDDNVLESWVVNDSTYTDGGFGFYNYSQGDVVYQSFTQEDIPEPTTAIIILVCCGALGLNTRTRYLM